MITLKQLNIFTINDDSNKRRDELDKNSESDYLEDCIGAIGPWQICVSAAAVLTRYIALGNLTSIVFLTPTTDFVCDKFENNVTLVAENNTCYKHCTKYMYHSIAMNSTLISDFGLICEKEWLASFTQTVLMFGVVIGVSIFGWLSDRYGRRIALISSTLLNIISMIPTPFIQNYWTFNCLRFVTGVATGGSLIICIPFAMEIVGKRYREYAGAFCVLPDAFAEASLALYAYYLPNWNTYLLGFSIVCTFIFIIVCYVPESPRWLISHGKVDQALEIITKAANFNKLDTEHVRDKVIKSVEDMKIKEKHKVTGSYLDFFKDRNMVTITTSTSVIWTVIGISYYGIYQYMTFVGINAHITVVILGLIQVPLCPIEIILTKLFSRKMSLVVSLLTTAVTMISLIFTPQGHWSSTVIGAIGFSASSFCFAVVYIYQAELFPTPLRSMSFGLASAVGKGGSMLAPFIAKLFPIWMPSLIFSVLSVVAACFCFLLPETKGKNLVDTID